MRDNNGVPTELDK